METHFFERAGYFLFLSSFEKIEKFLAISTFSSQAAFLTLQLHFRVIYSFIFLEMISAIILLVNGAAIETMDITKILTLQGGEAVYPLPRIKNLAVHPKFNLAAVIFAVRPC